MAIKDLFSRSQLKNLKLTSKSEIEDKLESTNYPSAYNYDKSLFVPHVDFDDLASWCKYGSAERYFADSFLKIQEFYPFDGSKTEKQEFLNSGSFVDSWIFDKIYPRTTGYANFSSDNVITITSTGAISSKTINIVSNPEYIYLKGGPNLGDANSYLGANLFSEDDERASNLRFGGSSGNYIEFWLKRGITGSNSEVVFSLNDYYSQYFTILLNNSGSSAFSIASVCSGSASQNVIDLTGYTAAQAFDNNWRHYGFKLSNHATANTFTIEFFVGDDSVSSTTGSGKFIDCVNYVHATIGGLIGSGSFATGSGKLSGSLDEFRFWKSARTNEEIGQNWFSTVDGGANTDDASTDIGVYYKFNEGVFSSSSIHATDRIVLDYSGRLSHGAWSGSLSTSRSTGSAIDSYFGKETEYKEPILYSTNPYVAAKAAEMANSGSIHDVSNNSWVYNDIPGWILEEDQEQEDYSLRNLTQIIGSYFDHLYLQVNAVSSLNDVHYSNDDEKPYPFNDKRLESLGVKVPDIFIDSTLLESLIGRSNEEDFEEKIYNVKNRIYENIYNNITNVLKSKGTEKSVRNLIRCFGTDEEVVKLNLYSDNTEYSLKNNTTETARKVNLLSLDDADNFGVSLIQATSSLTDDDLEYITGSTGFNYIPFTLEAGVVFPKRADVDSELFYSAPFVSSSLFGIKNYSTNNSIFKVLFVKEAIDSKNGYWLLTSSVFSTQLTSSVYSNVYDNEYWSFGVGLYPNSQDASNITSTTYWLDFYGVNYCGDIKQNSFNVSASISQVLATSSLQTSRRIYAGAARTNFTGSIEQYSDVKFANIRYFQKKLQTEEIDAHARDPFNYGVLNPSREMEKESNLQESQALALNWEFGTGSLSALTYGGISYYGINVTDYSSGSYVYLHNGSVDNVVERHYPGIAIFFTSGTTPQVREHILAGRQQLPESLSSGDMVSILSNDDEYFTRDSRPVKYFWALEKSIYQNVSEEILKFFAGVVDFNNLIGEPVNRYREEYKSLAKLRKIFFERIGNTPSVEKYLNYYKWIDSSIGQMVQQLIPATADFSEEMRTVVESHVLERNKYQTPYPTMEFKTEEPEAHAYGVNELLYNWGETHANRPPLFNTVSTLYPATEKMPYEAVYLTKGYVPEISGSGIHGYLYHNTTSDLDKIKRIYLNGNNWVTGATEETFLMRGFVSHATQNIFLAVSTASSTGDDIYTAGATYYVNSGSGWVKSPETFGSQKKSPPIYLSTIDAFVTKTYNAATSSFYTSSNGYTWGEVVDSRESGLSPNNAAYLLFHHAGLNRLYLFAIATETTVDVRYTNPVTLVPATTCTGPSSLDQNAGLRAVDYFSDNKMAFVMDKGAQDWGANFYFYTSSLDGNSFGYVNETGYIPYGIGVRLFWTLAANKDRSKMLVYGVNQGTTYGYTNMVYLMSRESTDLTLIRYDTYNCSVNSEWITNPWAFVDENDIFYICNASGSAGAESVQISSSADQGLTWGNSTHSVVTDLDGTADMWRWKKQRAEGGFSEIASGDPSVNSNKTQLKYTMFSNVSGSTFAKRHFSVVTEPSSTYIKTLTGSLNSSPFTSIENIKVSSSTHQFYTVPSGYSSSIATGHEPDRKNIIGNYSHDYEIVNVSGRYNQRPDMVASGAHNGGYFVSDLGMVPAEIYTSGTVVDHYDIVTSSVVAVSSSDFSSCAYQNLSYYPDEYEGPNGEVSSSTGFSADGVALTTHGMAYPGDFWFNSGSVLWVRIIARTADSSSYPWIYSFYDYGEIAWDIPYCYFDLTSGSGAIGSSSVAVVTSSITELGNAFYDCRYAFTATRNVGLADSNYVKIYYAQASEDYSVTGTALRLDQFILHNVSVDVSGSSSIPVYSSWTSSYLSGESPNNFAPFKGVDKYCFRTLFSSPGEKKTLTKIWLDPVAEELSTHNAQPFRNLEVRQEYDTSLQLHMVSGGLSTTGVANVHKTNCNPLRTVVVNPTEILQERYDNGFVSHQIPRSIYGYSWISGSTTQPTTGSMVLEFQEVSGTTNLVNWVGTASLNVRTKENEISTTTNTLTHNASWQTGSWSPYQWASWEQIRAGEGPVARALRKENIYSVEDPSKERIFVDSQGREKHFFDNRADSFTNYYEPVVTWNKPITHIVEDINKNIVSFTYPYRNLKEHFANQKLANRLNVGECSIPIYETCLNLYKLGEHKFVSIYSPEIIYPKHENVGFDMIHARNYYDDSTSSGIKGSDRITFWKDTEDDRTQSNFVNSLGFNMGIGSVWALEDGSGSSPYGELASMGETRTKDLIAYGRTGIPSLQFCYDVYLSGSTLKESGTNYTANSESGINPFYNSYDKYSDEIRPMGARYTILPEFRISEHMGWYINEAGGDFRKKNRGILTAVGTNVSSSMYNSSRTTANEEFYKIYSHSDMMKAFNEVYDDHKKQKDKVREFSMTFRGIKKLLPYNGFYPVQRSVQLGNLLSQSYAPYISWDTNKSNKESAIQSLIQPFYAPGIFYNTVKSGIAVDWPIMTGTTGDEDDFSVNYYSGTIKNYSGYRMPFESIIDPSYALPLSSSNNSSREGRMYLLSPDYEETLVAKLEQEITGTASSLFSYDMKLDRDNSQFVVGTFRDTTDPTGSVQVFNYTSGTWTKHSDLIPTGTIVSGDKYGSAVAIYGDEAFVGSYASDISGETGAGRVLYFKKQTNIWQCVQEITASDFTGSGVFGRALSFDGTTLAVGANIYGGGDTLEGRAYILQSGSSGYVEVAEFSSSVEPDDGAYGGKVLVSGTWAFVSEYGGAGTPTIGKIYIYKTNGVDPWSLLQAISASDGGADDYFGVSVAISGTKTSVDGYGSQLAVGSYYTYEDGQQAGSVYLYELDYLRGWIEKQKIVSGESGTGDLFGASVDFCDGLMIVGATGLDDAASNAGGVYLYEKENGYYYFREKISDGFAANDVVGSKVAVSGSQLFAGAHGADKIFIYSGEYVGSAYPFISWDGENKTDYSLASNNFFAESSRFFLKDEKFTSFVSKKESEFKTMQSGTTYYMDLILAKDGIDMVRSSDDNYQGRYFGPPSLIYNLTEVSSSDFASASLTNDLMKKDPSFIQFTPPYYYGDSICRVSFLADDTKKYTLDEILAGLQVESYDREKEELFRGIHRDLRTYKDVILNFVNTKLFTSGTVFTSIGDYTPFINADGFFAAYDVSGNEIAVQRFTGSTSVDGEIIIDSGSASRRSMSAQAFFRAINLLPVDVTTTYVNTSSGELYVRDYSNNQKFGYRISGTNLAGSAAYLENLKPEMIISGSDYDNFDGLTVENLLRDNFYTYSTAIVDSLWYQIYSLYKDSAAYSGSMPFVSSVDIFGKTREKVTTYSVGQETGARTTEDSDSTSFDRWVISTRYECPVLHVTSSNSSQGSSVWSSYGQIPTGSAGLYLKIEDSIRGIGQTTKVVPEYQISFANSTSDITVGSLLDVCGFTPSKKRVGEVASFKKFKEAVVAIPFLDEQRTQEPVTTEIAGRNFFKISRQKLEEQRRRVSEGRMVVEESMKQRKTTSITRMVEKMKNYIIPPEFDFGTYSDMEPFAMYIFEIEHTFTKDDLALIWQGLMPESSRRAEKVETSISHPFDEYEFFNEEGIPENTRWMVFKVKQKAEKNYFKVTENNKDDDRFIFDFQVGRKEPEYSYNWPYDFCSLVELGEIEADLIIRPSIEQIQAEGINVPRADSMAGAETDSDGGKKKEMDNPPQNIVVASSEEQEGPPTVGMFENLGDKRRR